MCQDSFSFFKFDAVTFAVRASQEERVIANVQACLRVGFPMRAWAVAQRSSNRLTILQSVEFTHAEALPDWSGGNLGGDIVR